MNFSVFLPSVKGFIYVNVYIVIDLKQIVFKDLSVSYCIIVCFCMWLHSRFVTRSIFGMLFTYIIVTRSTYLKVNTRY